MESREPKGTVMAKEIYIYGTYISNTRPLQKDLQQEIIVQGWNGIDSSENRCLRGSKKVRITRNGGGKCQFDKSLEGMRL